MKTWFPFTDYDFYAYLTSGLIVLFAVDYGVSGGAVMLREEWPFVQIVFVMALSYLVGQIVAGLASVIFEHWLARRVLRPPTAVMMDFGKARFGEHFIGRWVVGRYYELFSESRRNVLAELVAQKLGKQASEIDDAEDVFQLAFPVARSVPDAAARMDDFRSGCPLRVASHLFPGPRQRPYLVLVSILETIHVTSAPITLGKPFALIIAKLVPQIAAEPSANPEVQRGHIFVLRTQETVTADCDLRAFVTFQIGPAVKAGAECC